MLISPRSLLAAAAAVSAVIAVAATGVPDAGAAPPPRPTTTDPAVAASGWLAQQFVGGDHFDYPPTPGYPPAYWAGLTASGIFALAATKTGAGTIAAAAHYTAAHVADDADLAGKYGGPYDGSVATAALAAEVAGLDPASFGGVNLLQQLRADECPAGSSTCTPGAAKNIYSSVSESLAITAEVRAGGSYAPTGDAVAYFLSLQCPNGGFGQQPTACAAAKDASVDETAYAAMALEALGGHAAVLTKALDWLAAQRTSGGYWVSQGGPDADSTGLAVAALDGAGRDVALSRTWLATQQVTTGPTVGTGASRGAIEYQGTFNASSSVKATADAVLGLAPHGSLATLTAAGASDAAPVLALPAPRLSDARPHAGAKDTVTLGGFAAGEQVAVAAPSPLGTVRADGGGTATLTFTVPASLPAGPHEITLTGQASGLSGAAPMTVLATAAVPSSSAPAPPTHSPAAQQAAAPGCGAQPLACSGRDGRTVRDETALGIALLLAGAGALWLGRRRTRA